MKEKVSDFIRIVQSKCKEFPIIKFKCTEKNMIKLYSIIPSSLKEKCKCLVKFQFQNIDICCFADTFIN